MHATLIQIAQFSNEGYMSRIVYFLYITGRDIHYYVIQAGQDIILTSLNYIYRVSQKERAPPERKY